MGDERAFSVSEHQGRGRGARRDDYLDYLLSLPHLDTTVDNKGAGMSISYKRSASD